MTTPATTASWDRDGNIIVPRYGIRIAMSAALLAAGVFCLLAVLGDEHWRQLHPGGFATLTDPLSLLILWIAVPLLPFIFSILFLSRRSEESKAAGAGVAAGLFTCGLLVAITVFLSQFLSFFPDPYTSEKVIAISLFVSCAGWVLVSAFRIAAKAGWGIFFLFAVATLVCIVVGSHLLHRLGQNAAFTP